MRRWQIALLIALAMPLLLAAGAYWSVQKALANLPVQNLQYQLSSLSFNGVQLSHVSFRLEQAQLLVKLSDIVIDWQWRHAKLSQLKLGSGEISLLNWPANAEGAAENAADTTPGLPTNWQVPARFPDMIQINSLALHLPCQQSRCSYLLSAQLHNSPKQLHYQLGVTDIDSPQLTRLSLSGNYRTVQQLPILNALLQLDDNTKLQLQQQLSLQDGLSASGEFKLHIAPPSPWLLQQFALWQVQLPQPGLAGFTAPVTVQSDWQFQLPAEPGLANIVAKASGNWRFVAEIPTGLTLPGIGQLQGSVNAELGLAQGELSRYQLNSQLQLFQPQPVKALEQLGINADVLSINLTADGNSTPQLTALPLHLQLSSQGATTASAAGDITLNLTPPLSAQLRNATLDIRQHRLSPAANIRLDNAKLHSQFNAYWLADSWQIDVQNAQADITELNVSDLSAKNAVLVLTNSRISGDKSFNNLQLSAQPQLSLRELTHTELKPLSWQWQGKLHGSLAQFNAQGRLSNSANLVLTHQLSFQKTDQQTQNLQLSWKLDEMFLLAGNPLANTLKAWPALLELNRGRILGQGELRLLPALVAQATVNLSGISGIYDRSVFKDLNAAVQLDYQQQQLRISSQDAGIAEINHGIVAGPLLLTASYSADSAAITGGKLNITQAQMQLMGGQVILQPQQLDLSLAEQQLELTLSQIDISQILQQHPSSDISGNGSISGKVPLLLSRSGASIENGFIAAESPGGKLQYRPPTAQSMAASNPGMKVVLEALDDFHYSVLSSNVSYDTSGKLLLALQLQGQNPALQEGRPINLNINLEEDIPALITSLQLSSQISDKIKQRVQQKLQQSGAKRANGAQP